MRRETGTPAPSPIYARYLRKKKQTKMYRNFNQHSFTNTISLVLKTLYFPIFSNDTKSLLCSETLKTTSQGSI